MGIMKETGVMGAEESAGSQLLSTGVLPAQPAAGTVRGHVAWAKEQPGKSMVS